MDALNSPTQNPHVLTKAQITAIFEGREYVSMVLELKDGTEDTKTIQRLAVEGSNNIGIFKMPMSPDEFMIFSRFQLDQTIFKVKVWDEPLEPLKRTRKTA